jgi:hypothetical protein
VKSPGSGVVIPAAFLGRNPGIFPDYIEIEALDPGLKLAGVT